MEASSAEKAGYLDTSRLTPGELGGCISAVVLVLSMFLPWFGTSDSNPNSTIGGATGGDSVNAFQTFAILDYLLLAAAAAPFILAWIVARGHKLSWKPGEVTMIVGISAFILVLCNGIILGKPESKIEIGFSYGYPIALVAALGMAVCGFIRQAYYVDAKKPPGTIGG